MVQPDGSFLAELIGEHPRIEAVRQQVRRLLRPRAGRLREPPILIQGETGTGKGLLAHAIHRAGPRSSGPFVDVNCAAIPDTLLEAELFGYERGAFTDARRAKLGLFQTANRGTIFLDEIGLLPTALQAKILTVLEARTVRRLGRTQSEPVDVAIVTATSEDLEAAIREGRFRQDLYHRLAVVMFRLPPLRERGPDIVRLAEHFLVRACADYSRPSKSLNAEARQVLLAYGWPGNLRELANVMERVVLLSEESVVTPELLDLPTSIPDVPAPNPPRREAPLRELVAVLEREQLLEALGATSWNVSHAAARLGLSRGNLRYRMEKYGLRPQAATSRARSVVESGPATTLLPLPTATIAPVVRWERRYVALLRAVLVVAAEQAVPPDAVSVIAGLVEKLRSFGGRIEEMSPTGVLAGFGLEPAEDAAWRATQAALAIQKAAERAERAGRPRAEVAIGIHVARLPVGDTRGTLAIDPDAKRETWPILDQLVASAEAHAVRVSDAASLFLERRFELEPVGVLGPGPLRSCHRLLGFETTGYGLGGRALSRFVGRARELDVLHSVLESARRSRGQVVGIVGEPGVGKSRLLYEFTRSSRTLDCLILEAGAVSYGRAAPYQPVIHLLRARFKIQDRDDPREIREKVTASVLALDRTMVLALPALLALLDVPVDDPAWQALDPPQRRERTLKAIKRLILRESRDRMVIIVVEDLHWSDPQTEAVLDGLVGSLPAAQVLLLVSYRPEYHHGWGDRTYYTQLRIDPLPPGSASELLDGLSGEHPSLRPLKTTLIERTEGNPFFLEETVRSLREAGALSGEQGAYRLVSTAPRLEVPATVQAVLAARMDRLLPENKRLLQAAAVIGKEVPAAILRAIADLSNVAFRRELAPLQAAELLYETSFVPDPGYTFKHALTQEVAYASLPPEHRRELHARIVEAIERLYPGRIGEQVERLGHHAVQGQLWGKAVAYLGQAGAKAATRSADSQAVACLEEALVALGHLPESRETIQLAIDLRFHLRNSLFPLAGFVRIEAYLREAEALARRLDDQHRLGRMSAFMSAHHIATGGHTSEVRTFAQRAEAIGETLGDVPLQVAAQQHLLQAHYLSGDYPRAEFTCRRLLQSLEGERAHERFGLAVFPAVLSRAYLARVLAERGRFNEGDAHGREAIRISEALDHPLSLTFACLGFAYLASVKGDLDDAIRLLERTIALCRDWNNVLFTPPATAALGHVYACSGRADGVSWLEQGLAAYKSVGIGFFQSMSVAQLGEAYLFADQVEDARACADRGLALTRERGERGHEAWMLRLLGEIASHPDGPDAATVEAHYGAAMALASELGMRPLVAHCHLGLGKLSRRTGGRAKAEEHLATATTMYREMDMGFWLQRAHDCQ